MKVALWELEGEPWYEEDYLPPYHMAIEARGVPDFCWMLRKAHPGMSFVIPLHVPLPRLYHWQCTIPMPPVVRYRTMRIFLTQEVSDLIVVESDGEVVDFHLPSSMVEDFVRPFQQAVARGYICPYDEPFDLIEEVDGNVMHRDMGVWHWSEELGIGMEMGAMQFLFRSW